MKPRHLALVTGLAATLLVTGCATTQNSSNAGANRPAPAPPVEAPDTGHRGTRGEWNRTPEVGMTKAQVLTRYGDPRTIQQTPEGEVWRYRAQRRGRDFIPVYGAFTQQTKGGTIGFDAEGRVKAYDWGTTRWGTWW